MQKDNNHLHNYVYSSELVEFVRIANDFCSLMEQLKGMKGKEFIQRSVELLPGLYGAILKVQDTEPVFETPAEPTVTEQDWSTVYQQMALLLGSHNEYLRPAGEDEFDRSDLVTHTISEDLADLYQELRDFTTIYSRGMEELMNDAAWELKERFTEHWGKKLLNALNAMHSLYIKDIDPAGEE
jgi:hypothetical protein